MDESDPRYPAVQELTAYWLRHPHASDTLEGISRWWLSASPFPEPVVHQALAWLIESGVVAMQLAVDGRIRYRFTGASSPGPN